jgi:DNA polymerase-3 subunit gamma/tau
MTESVPAYRVLARKYRPQRFSELIGQEAMVQTLGNAIKRDRIAHAFLMTGVRGVGKTSTARLIAKALNCEGPDGNGGPTIDPCGVCEACVAIAEGRHIDVVEMDAASNTGVDDVREIIEAVRYSSVTARYKVYIIDEVHMLTKNAFNALLKTLEEPPAHVKFLFATTEINKVPVTVLSRCQRFDLRRIPADLLATHFAGIAEAEAVVVEPEALALVARAAEGSVRDGLSILDQAIAHAGAEGSAGGQGAVTAAQVREMLGLSDRGAVRRLFQLLLAADALPVLAALKEQHDLGVEPLSILRGLMEACHGVTLAKVGAPLDPAQSEEERAAFAELGDKLSFALLHRLWQMLLKGYDEVTRAAEPREALEMALLRLVYASSLPDPGELAAKLESGQGASAAVVAAGPSSAPVAAMASASTAASAAFPADFPALIALLERDGKMQLAQMLHDYAGLVRYAAPELDIHPVRPLPSDFARDLAAALKAITGATWRVLMSETAGAPSLKQQEEAREAAARDAILDHPIIKAATEAFPEAELISQRSM